jgi:aryl-phospho-beta-D-glucosidase BglC (GH1 family)
MEYLTIENKKIVIGGKPLTLKGVNLGGWLMPEGYIMHAPNRGYRFFKADFIKANGSKMFAGFERAFRDAFITEKDFAAIRALGFNCIRLPFHYALVETAPFRYSEDGVAYLDRAVRWANKHGLRIILDMHAAPGAQNHDWHSDSDGSARFWTTPAFQRRALALWQFLADRYKDEPAVAGYDLLNETVLSDPAPMNRYYHAAIKTIRSADRNHIIFVEGNRWGQDLACLDDFADDNLVLSFHFYEPLEFTFNFVPQLKYPLSSKSGRWDKATMRQRLDALQKVADRRNRPLWCGEFGVNARGGLYGEDLWLRDVLAHFRSMDIHWTYWTWKAVKHTMFPDGINSYLPNDPWVNRPGPQTGWETWPKLWPDQKKAMIASWKTEKFQLNKAIAKVLKNAC